MIAERLPLILTLVLTATGVTGFALAEPSADAARPHQALYELHMVKRGTQSGVASVAGTMAYEWTDACDAWLVDQRFVLSYGFDDGNGLIYTSDFSSWESKDGRAYRFSAQRREDETLTEVVEGRADLPAAGDGLAQFSQPEENEVALPAETLLPTEHLLMILDAIATGRRFFAVPMFDGSEPGEGVVTVSAVIGQPEEQPADAHSGEDIDGSLIEAVAWPVRLAFFDPESDDSLPEYEMTMWLQANGIVSRLRLDYPEFSLAGGLRGLRGVPRDGC